MTESGSTEGRRPERQDGEAPQATNRWTQTRPLDRRPVRQKASPWPFVGMSGLAAELFLYGASVLFLPWWGVALLVVLWLVLLLVGLRWFARRPRRTALLPVVGIVLWLGAVGLAVAAAGR